MTIAIHQPGFSQPFSPSAGGSADAPAHTFRQRMATLPAHATTSGGVAAGDSPALIPQSPWGF